MTTTTTRRHRLLARSLGVTLAVAVAGAVVTLPATSARAATTATPQAVATVPAAAKAHLPGAGLRLPSQLPTKAMPALNKAKVAGTLKASVDLRSLAMPVRHQGDHQSCVGWAIGYALMGLEAKAHGYTPPTFAPYYIYSQINGGKDQPTYALDAMSRLLSYGDDSVPDYWQETNLLTVGGTDDPITPPTAAEYANGAAWKISGYQTEVTQGYIAGVTGMNNIKQALSDGHPVAIGIYLRPGFDAMMGSGVSYDNDNTKAIRGGHEILAVGYTADGLLIQNSWGPTFGLNGFALLAWNVVQTDITSAFSITGFAGSYTTPTSTDKTAPVVGLPNSVPALGTTSGTAGATYYTTSFTASDASGIAATQVDVSVDGGTWVQLNLPSAAATSFNYVLNPGHSYQFIAAAQDKAGNWSGWSYGTKFSVASYSEAYASYSTGWTNASWASAVGGVLDYSGTTGASATFTFTSRTVAWVATKDPTRGQAQVYLDGVYKGVVDLNATTTAARSVVLWYSFSASGTHTLKLVVAGTAGHPTIDVDNFMLTG